MGITHSNWIHRQYFKILNSINVPRARIITVEIRVAAIPTPKIHHT